MSALVLAIPSKGRLKEQTEEYFRARNVMIEQIGRGYSARFPALPQIDVRLLSSSEIALALRDGKIHAGVIGEDLMRESEPAMTRVALIEPLGFGFADLVVAVPQCWVDVSTLADLDDAAHAFRARTGQRLRLATKYLAMTRAFFDQCGLDDYRLVESQGATEGAPASGAAEAIVDITTTGSTLKANHLKILDDGVILKSQANLAVSRAAGWDDASKAAFGGLLDALNAAPEAKAKFSAFKD
jgi:ATP phosphoribosyltransferase